jgi:hypothetical protein
VRKISSKVKRPSTAAIVLRRAAAQYKFTKPSVNFLQERVKKITDAARLILHLLRSILNIRSVACTAEQKPPCRTRRFGLSL